MRYISEKEYENRLRRIRLNNISKERKLNLKNEKNKGRQKIKLPSTSKLILLAVLLLNVQIIWFVEKAMMEWGDFSAAYALIGIPATLIPIIWAYYSKSKAENTTGGIVYDMAMAQTLTSEVNSEAEAETNNNTVQG